MTGGSSRASERALSLSEVTAVATFGFADGGERRPFVYGGSADVEARGAYIRVLAG